MHTFSNKNHKTTHLSRMNSELCVTETAFTESEMKTRIQELSHGMCILSRLFTVFPECFPGHMLPPLVTQDHPKWSSISKTEC